MLSEWLEKPPFAIVEKVWMTASKDGIDQQEAGDEQRLSAM